VPQDPNEEPALVLLSKISETRKKLLAEKRIPKPRVVPILDELELHFDVPNGRAWCRLGELCYQVSDGPHFSPQYVAPEDGVPFLSTRNIRPGGFDLRTVKYVSRADHAEFCKRIRPEKGDIIYTKGGTTGIAKINDLDFEFSVWVHLAVLRIEKKELYPRYVELALNSQLRTIAALHAGNFQF
jgi:type I restriction enzyme S subunit